MRRLVARLAGRAAALVALATAAPAIAGGSASGIDPTRSPGFVTLESLVPSSKLGLGVEYLDFRWPHDEQSSLQLAVHSERYDRQLRLGIYARLERALDLSSSAGPTSVAAGGYYASPPAKLGELAVRWLAHVGAESGRPFGILGPVSSSGDWWSIGAAALVRAGRFYGRVDATALGMLLSEGRIDAGLGADLGAVAVSGETTWLSLASPGSAFSEQTSAALSLRFTPCPRRGWSYYVAAITTLAGHALSISGGIEHRG